MNNDTPNENLTVLVAGGTGYLGEYIIKALVERGFGVRAIARKSSSAKLQDIEGVDVQIAEVTDASSLDGCCKDVDFVISTVGITRQKDGLTYIDVDFQANKNLLEEAKKRDVKKFIYISVFNGENLKQLKICEAKEQFVDALKNSGLEYCIVRPTGFFSDMTEFYNMAQKGRVFLFGDGGLEFNPIHGADLAEVCINMINSNKKELEVGGPETLTQTEIAETAFQAANLPVRITYIPDWIRRLVLKLARVCMNKYAFGPVEFFLYAMALDMKAPEYGKHTLLDYYKGLKK